MGGFRRGALVAMTAVLVACAAPRKLGSGGQCELNSECAAPLVCRVGACRNECATDRDCTGGASCVRDAQGLGICQVAAELHCAMDSDCRAPLVCRSMRCVNTCATDRDCPPGNACMDVAGGRGCIDTATEASCVRDSECTPPFRCATDGRCRPECLSSRDCRFDTVCVASRCLAPGTDAGAVGDAGATDGGATDGGACPSTSTATSLAVGLDYACAVVAGGDLYCWGSNANGTLGLDPTVVTGTPAPTRIAVTGASRVLAADAHACAMSAMGAGVSCWGNNAHGQLGDGTTTQRLSPVTPAGLAGGFVSALSVGTTNTCAIVGGAVSCWGEQSYGALGDGTTGFVVAPVTVPTPVAGVPSPMQVAVWTHGACVLDTSGAPYCFGRNDLLQAGTGVTTTPVATPTAVPGLTLRSVLYAGAETVCVSGPGGVPTCWGDDSFGQLGDGTPGPPHGPVPVTGFAGSVALGRGFTCGVGAGGEADCWGKNAEGELGDGTLVARATPQPVVPALPAILVAAGSTNACAIGTDRSVYCWGANAAGVLGLAQPVGTGSSTPVRVSCLP